MFRAIILGCWCHSALWVICLLAGGGCGAGERPAQVEIGPAELTQRLSSSEPFVLGERGVELPVVHEMTLLRLEAPGTTELELELTTSGVVLLSYFADDGSGGPPWRYVRLRQGPSVVRLNMLTAEGWTPASRPALRFEGSGRITIRMVRGRGLPPDPIAALDRARLRAPESVGHTTINSLSPVIARATSGTHLATALAGLALVAFIVIALGLRFAGRPGAPRTAAIAALLLLAFTWNAHFLLVRFLPLVRAPALSVETRIRDNYVFEPEVGEVAALARTTLPLDARVGVLVPSDDWFAAQALCFLLAPRRCVRVNPNEATHLGLGGIERMTDGELDALVAFHPAAALPPGFSSVAAASVQAIVLRRK
jgi:hypothetical protein